MTHLNVRRAGAWAARALAAAALAGLAFPTPSASAETLREETSERYALEPGARVDISNVNGDLEVASWDRAEALVEITKVAKTRGHDRASEALEDLRIEIEHSPQSLTIKTRHPSIVSGIASWLFGSNVQYRVTYRVTLPREVWLEASTVNGDVRLEEVAGTIEARTTNGEIELRGAAGATTASTTNGSIRAEFVDLASDRDVDLRTTNGGIVVYVPPTAAATVSASTVNGAVATDFAVLSSGGSAWQRKTLRGAINGGGGQLTLQTVNGSIHLRSRAGV